MIEAHGTFEHVAEAHLSRIFGAAAIVNGDASLRGKEGECLAERQAVALHDEGEDVAAFATAEALPSFPGRRDNKRGGFLTMEWAESLERRTRLAQHDRLADDVGNGKSALDLSDAPGSHRWGDLLCGLVIGQSSCPWVSSAVGRRIAA